MCKVVLLEDEPFFQVKVERMLADSQFSLVKSFASTDGVLEYLMLNPVDVFLSDLIIDGKPKGADFIQKLNLPQTAIVAISTSVDQDIFDHLLPKVFSYLVKPFHKLSLLSTLDAAVRSLPIQTDAAEQANGVLFLAGAGGRKERVRINEIIYVEVELNYCFVHTIQHKYAIKTSLNKFMKETGNTAKLVRVHYKYTINPRFIESYDAQFVTLFTGKKLPLSSTFKSSALSIIKRKTP